jgi:endonuclease YncB( thermonuclease family)
MTWLRVPAVSIRDLLGITHYYEVEPGTGGRYGRTVARVRVENSALNEKLTEEGPA